VAAPAALGARPHRHGGQRGHQVGVKAPGRSRGGRATEVPDTGVLTGHDDGVAAERPVRDAGFAQPQHGQQDLIQGAVGEGRTVGLGQGRAVGHPGDQRRIVAGPEPAGGEHVGHQHPGALGHQGEVGLVLDLLQAIHDEGGARIPVHAEPPQFR
jgi:hypothetical protein